MDVTVEALSPTEQRVLLRDGDSWCKGSALTLRSGMKLEVTQCRFVPGFSFQTVQPAAELELVLSRGAALMTRMPGGDVRRRAGGALQVGSTRAPLPIEVSATDGAPMECVSVSLAAARLRELLGTAELPSPFLRDEDLISHAMTPRLDRVLDEVLHADVRGPGRLLWHEAKGLELIGLVTDELAEVLRGEQPLSASDVERLERVRLRLTARLEQTPPLSELARLAGLSETRLKGAFRARFGAPVFTYLRQQRMEEARRLLSGRGLNVTEVALRVGYSNPSKFAAAFRREFGVSPAAATPPRPRG